MGWADLKYVAGVISHEITEGSADITNHAGQETGWHLQEPFSWPAGNVEICDYCNDPTRANQSTGSGETFTFTDPSILGGGTFQGGGVGTYADGSFASTYWDDSAGGCRAPGSNDANKVRSKANKIIYSNGPFFANCKIIWIFWGSAWKTQTTPSKTQILHNFSLLEQNQYYSSLQQYNMNKPKYFMDIIYDDPNYQPVQNYQLFTKAADPSGNPDDVHNVQTVVINCINTGLVPTPAYKNDGTVEQFMYVVLAPQGIEAGHDGQYGAGAHMLMWSDDQAMPNRWNTGTGGGGGGFTAVYDTTTDTFASDYWDLDGTAATRAGEVFETGSGDVGKKLTQIVLMLKKTGAPTGTANVVIRKLLDDSVAVTLGTIDATTITTSEALYTFTKTDNTYAIVEGDKLLLEHTGT